MNRKSEGSEQKADTETPNPDPDVADQNAKQNHQSKVLGNVLLPSSNVEHRALHVWMQGKSEGIRIILAVVEWTTPCRCVGAADVTSRSVSSKVCIVGWCRKTDRPSSSSKDVAQRMCLCGDNVSTM